MENLNKINALTLAIQTSIDIICEDHDFKITYVEINAALLNVLKSNNSFELRSLNNQNKK